MEVYRFMLFVVIYRLVVIKLLCLEDHAHKIVNIWFRGPSKYITFTIYYF